MPRTTVLVAAALRRALSTAPRREPPRWKPKATLTGRLEALLQAPAPADDPDAAEKLRHWFEDKRRVVVLSGAGLSTDSGIPDYRGVAGSYRRGHTPVSHDEFMRDSEARRRYWARALVGYDAFAAARPNAAHDAVAALQRAGRVSTVITQNVDGLHEKAGATSVVPLHGRGYRVACTDCGLEGCRTEYHGKLAARNPSFAQRYGSVREGSQALRPDGDAAVEEFDGFDDVPACEACGGIVKPAVTFFGDVVPRDRVDACFEALDAADGLLCVGTSLAVYSAFRFVRRACADGLPVAVLNRGPTRCDAEDLSVFKVNAGVAALAEVAAGL